MSATATLIMRSYLGNKIWRARTRTDTALYKTFLAFLRTAEQKVLAGRGSVFWPHADITLIASLTYRLCLDHFRFRLDIFRNSINQWTDLYSSSTFILRVLVSQAFTEISEYNAKTFAVFVQAFIRACLFYPSNNGVEKRTLNMLCRRRVQGNKAE